MGVLAACGIALRFRNPWKNPRRDFSKAGSGNGISCLPYNTELWRVALQRGEFFCGRFISFRYVPFDRLRERIPFLA